MNDNYQTEIFLTTIKSMKDYDLMFAYKKREDYSFEFAELLVEEMSIRGYDATEIEKMSFDDIDIFVIKNKNNKELIEIYYKRNDFKTGWNILAKNELKNRGIDVEKRGKKPSLFKNHFSFNGRIRRLEYGLSWVISVAYFVVGAMFIGFMFPNDNDIDGIMVIFFIFACWFIFSQGARRCHDLGHSGLLQFIPFYVFAMWFVEGDLGINKYGENPKGKGNF